MYNICNPKTIYENTYVQYDATDIQTHTATIPYAIIYIPNKKFLNFTATAMKEIYVTISSKK